MVTIGKKPVVRRKNIFKYAIIILAISYIAFVEWRFSMLKNEINEQRSIDKKPAQSQYCVRKITDIKAYLYITSHCRGVLIDNNSLITETLLHNIGVIEPKYLMIDAIGTFATDLNIRIQYMPGVIRHYFPALKGVYYIESNYLGIHTIASCKTTSTHIMNSDGKLVEMHNACIL